MMKQIGQEGFTYLRITKLDTIKKNRNERENN